MSRLETPRGGLVAAVTLYTLLTLAYFGGALTDPAHRCACASGTDPETYMWFLSWWPHAILHGHNPFHTTSLFAPDRVNLGAVIVIPGAATVLAPITLLFGPIVSYNLLVIAAPAVAAVFAFMLCRYLTGQVLPALVGGYVFGFSPYVLGHMMGHPDLLLIFPIPAIVHVCLRRFDGRIDRRRAVVYLVVLFAMLYLSTPEVTFTFVLIGAITLAVAYGLVEPRREDIIELVRTVLLAGVISVVLMSVVIYYALTGDVTDGFFHIFRDYGADGLGWVVPTQVERLGRAWFLSVSSRYGGNLAENGVYIGVPFALVLVRYCATRWALAGTRVIVTVLCVLVILASGAHLHLAGFSTVPLPWDRLAHLPLLSRTIPLRLAMYVFLLVGIVVALWLARPRTGRALAAKWGTAAVGVALLFPNFGPSFWSSRPDNPRFFTTNMYRHYLTKDETVLVLPWGQTGDSMLWQAETGFWFRQAGAYVGALLPLDYQRDPLLAPFHGSTVPPTVNEVRGFLAGRDVGAVIIEQGRQGYWAGLLSGIGLHGTAAGGVVVYPVHQPLPL